MWTEYNSKLQWIVRGQFMSTVYKFASMETDSIYRITILLNLKLQNVIMI